MQNNPIFKCSYDNINNSTYTPHPSFSEQEKAIHDHDRGLLHTQEGSCTPMVDGYFCPLNSNYHNQNLQWHFYSQQPPNFAQPHIGNYRKNYLLQSSPMVVSTHSGSRPQSPSINMPITPNSMDSLSRPSSTLPASYAYHHGLSRGGSPILSRQPCPTTTSPAASSRSPYPQQSSYSHSANRLFDSGTPSSRNNSQEMTAVQEKNRTQLQHQQQLALQHQYYQQIQTLNPQCQYQPSQQQQRSMTPIQMHPTRQPNYCSHVSIKASPCSYQPAGMNKQIPSQEFVFQNGLINPFQQPLLFPARPPPPCVQPCPPSAAQHWSHFDAQPPGSGGFYDHVFMRNMQWKHDRTLKNTQTHYQKTFNIEDFELFNTLGTGTFGRVMLCRLKNNANAYFALKIMQKSDVMRLKQLEHVYNEKTILNHVNFPFIVQLHGTFQNRRYIYMLLEYAVGGELFSYLRKLGKFPVEASKFYAAEILLTLEYLHYQNILYRDLKPENLLLDAKGHIRMTDFGFAKYVTDRTWTLCGTPEYLAPEIIQGHGHGKEVDWWALGVLIYEMLVGYPPFYDNNAFGIYEKILVGKIHFPEGLDACSRDLISKLLNIDKSQRLGNLKNGAIDVKNHPWFKNTDWSGLLNKTVEVRGKCAPASWVHFFQFLQAPLLPQYGFPGDTANFEAYEELCDEAKQDWDADPYQQLFVNF